MTGSVLDRLREPFSVEQVEYRPEVNCRACLAGNCVEHEVVACANCNQTISTQHVDLPYIGHVQVTQRLLAVDPEWTWQPLALTPAGLPLFDDRGGLWIKLIVHEVPTNSRKVAAHFKLGYGHPGSVSGADGVKATISDAIRNAATRFGVALEVGRSADRDRSMVDGRPGLPSGQADDPRAPFWELIRTLSTRLGRSNREITEAFDAWAWLPETADLPSLAGASMTELAGYMAHLAAELAEFLAVAQ